MVRRFVVVLAMAAGHSDMLGTLDLWVGFLGSTGLGLEPVWLLALVCLGHSLYNVLVFGLVRLFFFG